MVLCIVQIQFYELGQLWVIHVLYSGGSISSGFIFPSIFCVIYFRCFRAFCSYTRTLCAHLWSGFTTSCNSGSVTGCCKFMFLTETPMWVPSQANTLGLCLHIGSISFQKSILNADNLAKMYAINVFPDRKAVHQFH